MIVQGIELQNVYKNGRGLKRANFTIEQGRIVALVGGNGAGKSTLIRLLTKQEQPKSGKLVWETNDDIRFMPDDVDFPNTLTAQEVLTLLGALKNSLNEEQQQVLERVGLADVQQHRVKDFSKGMRQRLNLAQSLLGGNGLLIMDEPTNGLDPYWIARLKDIMHEEKAKGATILFSTHMLAFAEQLADDVLVMHEGVMQAASSIEALYAQYGVSTLEQYWLEHVVQSS